MAAQVHTGTTLTISILRITDMTHHTNSVQSTGQIDTKKTGLLILRRRRIRKRVIVLIDFKATDATTGYLNIPL